MKKYLQNPFNALYQDETLLSDKPEIKELNQYARDLESQISGDFNLEYLTFEFAYNQLAFVRNGLLLAKIKFLKLYKNYGDGTFASFCKQQLRKQRWQINDTIKAARVVLDLMYAGFDILPTNISQAVALAKLTTEELIEKWREIIKILPLDKITAKSIRNLIFPEKEEDKTVATIQVPFKVREDIHSRAAERGLSIADFLIAMLEFFLENEQNYYDGERLVNSHLGAKSRATPRRRKAQGNARVSHFWKHELDTANYREKEHIWQQDLADLVKENPFLAI